MAIFSYFPFLLYLSFSFIFNTISIFKKHIHSSLNSLALTDNHKLPLQCHRPFSSLATTGDLKNVKPDSGLGIRSVDNIGEGLDSCTESLGFENSLDNQIDEIDGIEEEEEEDDVDGDSWRRKMRSAECSGNWRNVRSFPPPISSLNRNCHRRFILVPARKNGRLELTKVRIRLPEILCASRQDGRLRMHLIPDLDDVEEEEEEEEEEEQELVEEEEGESEKEIIVETAEEDELIVEEIGFDKEEERVEEWITFPNGAFRRCHEVVNQPHHVIQSSDHHHHHMHTCGFSIA